MSGLTLLLKQHDEIAELMTGIEKLLAGTVTDSAAKELALKVNTMAGKLKMHLMSEDKHLYPQLMNSDAPSLRNTARQFYTEMGQLAEVFAGYVQNYNVPAKILKDTAAFKADTKKVFEAVRNRIGREDTKLYPLIND